jgi:hypothetical protein
MNAPALMPASFLNSTDPPLPMAVLPPGFTDCLDDGQSRGTPDARQSVDGLVRHARQRLDSIRQKSAAVPGHRALRRLPARWLLLVQALLLPALACAVLLHERHAVLAFWKDCLDFWLPRLDIPLKAGWSAGADSLRMTWLGGDTLVTIPGPGLKAGTATGLLLLFASTWFYGQARLPLACLIRLICCVHALALLFFWLLPAQFPYTIADHVNDMLQTGFRFLVAIPVLLALGYAILQPPLSSLLGHTLLIIGYFMLLLPHQMVLHALVLRFTTLLSMPVLYLCFGSVLDVLLFIGLYSWAVSRMPLAPDGRAASR